MKKSWQVQPDESTLSIIEFLQEHLLEEAFSRRKIKKFIDRGWCFVNERVVRTSGCRIASKQVVTLILPDESLQRKQQCLHEILYEDDAILAYNKPAGIASDRLTGALFHKVFLVHRLDKDTTGVLLFAKSKEILNILVEQFRARAVKKTYWAIVDGSLRDEQGTICNKMAPLRRTEGRVLWGVVQRDGVEAHTEWSVRKRSHDATLVELMPHTGRTHQLRVHMSSIGHPILGDTQYASRFRCRFEALRQLLHASEVALRHPLTTTPLVIAAPLPPDFSRAIQTIFYDLV